MNAKLIKSVIKQLGGKESLIDVYNHGADGGYHGFIYYAETAAFFRKNKAAIVKLAESLADDLGENVLDVVKGFNCLRNDFTTAEVARVLYGNWSDKTDYYQIIANALAWFALEEVARYVTEQEEEVM